LNQAKRPTLLITKTSLNTNINRRIPKKRITDFDPSRMRVKVGVIGGSGFYKLEELENTKQITVDTRWGEAKVVVGTLGGVDVVLLARHGTSHSVPPGEVNYRANIWALRELGVTHVLATTACGSLREAITPGLFLLPSSFIDRTTGRPQSFYSSDGLPGVCHIPMEPAFCPSLRALVAEKAKELGFPICEGGTVVTIQGPRFSSKAESHMFRLWGADVVNMTTVPEVVLAKEAGLLYAAIAMPTDYDCWKEGQVVDVTAVMEVFASNTARVKRLVVAAVKKIGSQNWDSEIEQARNTPINSIVPGSTAPQ